MDPITKHHYENIVNGGTSKQGGDTSTVKTMIVEIDGQHTLIPSVWDGEVLSQDAAIKRAIDSGVQWETGSVKELEEKDKGYQNTIMETSPSEAKQILSAATKGEFKAAGNTLTKTDETHEGGHPVWRSKETPQENFGDEEYSSLMSPSSSKRPELRPASVEKAGAISEQEDFYAAKDAMFAEEAAKLDTKIASGYNLGGLSIGDSTAGIMTPEGQEMADKKFQLEPKLTDTNGDGESSAYEKIQGEAKQKTDSIMGFSLGGSVEDEEVDPVSGNPIPLGSTAENVRDDIPAMLSQGEYVLPANVVSWHGLKTITDMQSEAEMGLMMLHADGLIGGQELDDTSDDVEETKKDSKNDGKAKKKKKAKSAPAIKKKKNVSFLKRA